MTSETGAIVERYEYDAYGEPRVFGGAAASGAEGFAPLHFSAAGNPYLHQGLRRDDESGLHENRYRTLHSRLGRFMQRDPLGYVDGMNEYQYGQSSPTVGVDPTGELSLAPKVAIGIGIAGGGVGAGRGTGAAASCSVFGALGSAGIETFACINYSIESACIAANNNANAVAISNIAAINAAYARLAEEIERAIEGALTGSFKYDIIVKYLGIEGTLSGCLKTAACRCALLGHAINNICGGVVNRKGKNKQYHQGWCDWLKDLYSRGCDSVQGLDPKNRPNY